MTTYFSYLYLFSHNPMIHLNYALMLCQHKQDRKAAAKQLSLFKKKISLLKDTLAANKLDPEVRRLFCFLQINAT